MYKAALMAGKLYFFYYYIHLAPEISCKANVTIGLFCYSLVSVKLNVLLGNNINWHIHNGLYRHS